MKKLLTLIATATLVLSTASFAEDAQMNQGMPAASDANSPTVMADANGTEEMTTTTTETIKETNKDSKDADKTTEKKTKKKHVKKHTKKKHCHCVDKK